MPMVTPITSRDSSKRWLAACVLGLCCVLAACAGPGNTPGRSLAQTVGPVLPTVVSVTVVSDDTAAAHPLVSDPDLRRFLRRQGIEPPQASQVLRRRRLGSGIIWDASQGLVLTNAHLVQAADQVVVTTADGAVHPARVIGLAPSADAALLQTAPLSAPPPRLGRSASMAVGDFVLVVGNPFGLGQSVSSGIVSAVDRVHRDATALGPMIQTDASINPGNSGGPLLNAKGQIVALTTALVSPTNSHAGIGFAIPIERIEIAITPLLPQKPGQTTF